MAQASAGHGAFLLTPPEQHWECSCGRTSVTRIVQPHAQLHPCPLVGGLLTPYRPAGTRGQVTAALREDYEHSGERLPGTTETLARDERGRPHISVTAEYDTPDGGTKQHIALFVPGVNIDLRIGYQHRLEGDE